MVIGDLMLDEYWEGDTLRISPEAPVPVVHVRKKYQKAGGASNVALNIASLGAQVCLLGLTGQDKVGEQLKKILHENEISTYFDEIEEIETIRKLRIISQHHQLIRADFESDFSHIDKKHLLALYQMHLSKVNVVILSDYDKGTLSESKHLIELAQQQQKKVIVDPKRLDYNIYNHADLLTPNFKEFEAAAGVCYSEADIAEKAHNIIKVHHLAALLVTRGADGMSLFQRQQPDVHIPTRAQEVFDVTGAGDTVIAVIGTALSAGYNLETAVNLANTAAGIVVGKMGTATLTAFELQQTVHENNQLAKGVVNEKDLQKLVSDAQHKGETIVMTNGCFDILHTGHVDYLKAAKKMGDRLIVAVNTDESVRHLKGPDRPLNILNDRMKLLAALEAVDWVVPFSESTPQRLIEAILPDILVKGADYQVHEIAGSTAVLENGGQVKTIELTPNQSTTGMIKKILGETV